MYALNWRVEQTGDWLSMLQPFVIFALPYSYPGTIDRIFPEDHRSTLLRGFVVGPVET